MEVRKLTNTTGTIGQLRQEVGERFARPDPRPGHVLNTSRVVEEDMESLDEDDLAFITSGTGWAAEFEDGSTRPLVLWGVRESGEVHGVVVGEDGSIDASVNVGEETGFVRYTNIGGK